MFNLPKWDDASLFKILKLENRGYFLLIHILLRVFKNIIVPK